MKHYKIYENKYSFIFFFTVFELLIIILMRAYDFSLKIK